MTTALVRNYATERYGSDSPENIRHTINDFNHYLTQQGDQGIDNMNHIISGFVSGNGYGWGDTTNEVHNSIAATRDMAENQSFKQIISTSANDAGAKTFNVKEDNLYAPQSGTTMDHPSSESVTRPANNIRERNRLEESGNGGIHTTPSGLAKEMVGLDKGAPPRPTHDLYRNQSFYHDGNLIERYKDNSSLVLPSGRIIYGDQGYRSTDSDKEFWKGSVFEKK